jgi:hypothetical protein
MLMHGLMMHCVAIASAKNSPAAAKGATELARKFKTLHEAVIKQFHTAKSNATVAKPFSNVTKTAKSLPLEAMLGAHHYNNFFTCTDPPVNYPGDGYCDAGNNVYPCFDGGDCCRISCEENCGDGSCTYSCGAHSGAGPDGYNCTDNRYLAPEHHYDPAMFTCPERPAANWPGDGYCDSSNNVAPCFDGGDCCPTSCAMNCNGSAGCHYTCGDGTTDACIDTRYDQPSQHYDTTLFFCPNPPTTNYPGDGFCDSSNNVAPCFECTLSRSEPWPAASGAHAVVCVCARAAAATAACGRVTRIAASPAPRRRPRASLSRTRASLGATTATPRRLPSPNAVPRALPTRNASWLCLWTALAI